MKKRIILYTGKGGVGKTSISAATASLLASKGYRTLIISTDPAHSLGDALDVEVGPRPKEISKNLYAQEVSVIEAINAHWEELKVYLTGLFQSQGLDPVSAEEIATLPGFDEASHLLYLKEHIDSGKYDIIVMDSAPTGEALKLLSFPEAMTWYMEKLFPISRSTAKIVRPIMKPFLSVPLPEDKVFASAETLYRNLKDVRELLTDSETTSIRLVTNPDRMSFSESKRAFTYLLLYGYPVDTLIINKIYEEATGNFFDDWRKAQKSTIKEMEEAFAEIKIFKAPLAKSEPVGVEKLSELAKSIYGDIDPNEIFYRGRPIEYMKDGEDYLVKIKLPFASKEKLNLYNKGGELVIEIENWRRVFYLPQSLSDRVPTDAEFKNEYLYIRMGQNA